MIISHNSIGNTLNFIFFKIMRIAMKCHKFLIYTFVLISALSINNPKSYCLVGLENDNSSSNLPNNGTHIKHESANKTTQKNKKNKNNMLQTGARPSNIPDFPQIKLILMNIKCFLTTDFPTLLMKCSKQEKNGIYLSLKQPVMI